MEPDPTDSDRSDERIDDEEIEAVIGHYDDPSHPDALTVETAREHLGTIQQWFLEEWQKRLLDVRERRLEVASDTGDSVVFHDPKRRFWDRLLDDLDLYDSVDRTVLRVIHHRAGERIAGTSFDGTDPIVVTKPRRADAGQQFLETVIGALTGAGLSHAEAWAYYGIEIRGYDGKEWIDSGFAGDRIELADAVERAREKLDAGG